MKILMTGDFHLIDKGVRSQVIIDYLDYLWKYYKKNNLELIAINGDIFDRGSTIKNSFVIPLCLKLYEMKKDGVNFVFMTGNHDSLNVDNDSFIETFRPYGEVIKKCETINYGGRDITFLSYTKNEQDIPKEGDVLVTHLSIADFDFDNAYHATEKHAFKREIFKGFNKVFTGHFHKHQHKENIIYVGSPVQVTAGEINQDKGFVVFDTNTNDWEFVKYDLAPKYFKLDSSNIKDLEKIDFRNKIVVVKLSNKIKDFSKLRYVLFEKGAIDIIPVLEKNEDINVSVKEKVEMKQNIKETVTSVINGIKINGISNDRLLELFNKASEGIDE